MFDTLIHKTFNIPYALSKKVDVGSGTTVILLHGLASSHHNWDLVVPKLAGKCRIISFDLLGFGDSPKPNWSNYTLSDHLRSIHRSIRKLGLDKPYILVGHSMGSIISVAYAHAYPNEVRSLVLCSLPIYTTTTQQGKFTINLDAIYQRIYVNIIQNKNLSLYEAGLIKKIMKYSDEFNPNDMTWHGTAESLKNTILTQSTLELAKDLPQKIDLIAGRADVLVIKKHLDTFVKTAPNAHLTMVNAPHLINDVFADEIATKVISQISAR